MIRKSFYYLYELFQDVVEGRLIPVTDPSPPYQLGMYFGSGWAGIRCGDVIAGITGALVLVPKAMAYAQLSGLPVYFGLYVALVPAILGALWGSSRPLAAPMF